MQEYEALAQAARTLTNTSDDTAPETLARNLLGIWHKKTAEISGLKTDLQNVSWEKDLAQNELKVKKMFDHFHIQTVWNFKIINNFSAIRTVINK